MAFFGVDGLEHQVKQLKAVVSSKDYEITSVRNELRKKDEELNDLRRMREAAEYKSQEEAERAHKAETALQQRSTELANLRLQHDNLQSTLRAATDKLKAGEKENRGLQYDNESLGFSSAEAKRLSEERDALSAKVKDLERRLLQSEETVKSLRSSASQTQTMKRSSTDFFGSSFSPAPAKRSQGGNRRRSTSLSSDNRLTELEAELNQLRPQIAELEKIRTQLTNVKKELDKVTNAKLALERSSKREMEDLKSQMEDLNYELGEWRRDDGSGGKAEVEKVKKALAAEMEGLRGRTTELERLVEEKTKEVDMLEGRVSRMTELESEVAEERRRRQAAESTSASASEISQLEEKIATLESALDKARTASVPSSSTAVAPASDLSTRQLQRELKYLRAEVERQREDLAAQDEEITRLTKQSACKIPLPSSPGLAPTDADDLARIEELEQKLVTAKSEVEELRAGLRNAEEEANISKAMAEAAVAQRSQVETELQAAQHALDASEARATHLESELETLRGSANASQTAIDQMRQEVEQACHARDVSQKHLDELNARVVELSTSLASRSHDNAEVQTIRESLQAKAQAVSQLEEKLAASVQREQEFERSIQSATNERDSACSDLLSRQEEISSLMDRLVDAEDRLKLAAAEKKASVKSIKEKYRETLAEADSFKLRLEDAQKAVTEAESRVEQMQERYEEASKSRFDLELALNELREEVANRSTESEARQRDEALFDNKEALQTLQATLDTERSEHARELELATFVLTKDLEEARGCITELEGKVAGLGKVSNNLRLAEDKIHRLRAERDDLRLSLSYVNHEQRFASQAADSHRQALDLARVELDSKNAALETLDKEYADASARFGHVSTKLESDLAQATESRAALIDRVQDMEEKLKDSLAEHQEQASTLVSELALARSKASRAEAELSALRRANKDLEIRHDRIQAILEVKRESDARVENEGHADTTTERPASGSGHRRRRSGVPSPTMDLVEALKVEKADLLGRISRRDARIKGLENEIKQVKVNLHLAQEAAMENEEDRDESDQRLTELQAALEGKSGELATLQQSLAEAESALANSQSTLKEVEARISSLESDLRASQSTARVYERSLQEVIVALAAEHHAARLSKQRWDGHVRSLQASDASLDRIHTAASAALGSAKAQIVSLSTELCDLQADLADKSTQLDAARNVEQDLNGKLQAGQTELLEMGERLAGSEETASQLRVSAERVVVLERELEGAKEQLQLRQTDVEELLSKLASAEKSRGTGEQDAAALADAVRELEEMRAEKAALLDTLAELEKEMEIVQGAHAEAIEGEKRDRAVDAERLSEEIRQAREELAAKAQQLADSASKIEQLERALSDGQNRLEEATRTSESDRATICALEAGVAEMDAQSRQIQELSAMLDAERATVAQLRATISDLQSTNESIDAERTSLLAKTAQLDSELVTARADLARHGEMSTRAETDQAIMDELRVKIQTLDMAAKTLSDERDQLTLQVGHAGAEISALKVKDADLREENAKTAARVSELETDLVEARASLARADAEVKAARDASSVLQGEVSALTAEKEALASHLQADNATIEALRAQTAEMDSLRGLVSGLEDQLASRGVSSVADGDVQDLKDRIAELEASLSLKVQEVDEADDRVKEVYKEKVKLEKKVAKLQRQLASATSTSTAETAANTAANRHIPDPAAAVEMPPPPVPKATGFSSTPKTAAQGRVLASPRQPLRPVAVLADKVLSPGMKRAREDKSDEKPRPVEMILLPPSQLDQSVKTTPRSAFKPLRRALGEVGTGRDRVEGRERVNVFSEH